MNTRKKAAAILPFIPLALLAVGFAATAIYGAWANAKGMWTEGGEWLIFIFFFLPFFAAIAIALAVVALRLDRQWRRPFVTIVSVIDIVLAVPGLLVFLLHLLGSL